MPAADFDTERTYDAERFATREVFRTDRSRVVCEFFEPGQFVPAHAPGSDVVVSVRDGTGTVREGESDHRVDPGDADHEPVRRGIRQDEFEPPIHA
jgi:quercetin dioxygenase-like cupin family protein